MINAIPTGIREPAMYEEDPSERRRYFRIDDDVILSFRAVEAACMELRDEDDPQPDAFTLSTHLELLGLESRSLLRRIEREDPLLGDYLRLLEQKIDLIGRGLMSREADTSHNPARRVSLSASGLAFNASNGFTLGDTLELKLILPPSLVGLRAYGRVVQCRKGWAQDPTDFHIAVDFVGLSERDRELLIRHIIKRQSQQLRSGRTEITAV
jgi:hypothetical protein